MTLHTRMALCGAFLALAACATGSAFSVHRLLSERQAHQATRVSVVGVLGLRHGLVNLFSRNGRECIGLLTHVEDRDSYAALNGQMVSVSGTLEAEGCGRDGICDEHLCGPAILRDVTVSRGSRLG